MPQGSVPRTIVTAADHRYVRTLAQLLLSIDRWNDDAAVPVVIFDLGLTDGDRELIGRRFPSCSIERFGFDVHPAHVRRLDICAWKPVAVDETILRRGGIVLWLDSATIIHQPIRPIFDRIARDGLLTLAGQSPIGRWCHDATLRFMNASPVEAARRCRAAGILGFDATRADVRDLVGEWRQLAMIPECIDPPGATRANHRYDQAILSLLVVRRQVRLKPDTTGAGRLKPDTTGAGRLKPDTTGAGRLKPDATDEGDDGDDEIDISSARPVRWASTRNKVAPWVPLALDPIVRAYYATYKAADRALIRALRKSP